MAQGTHHGTPQPDMSAFLAHRAGLALSGLAALFDNFAGTYCPGPAEIAALLAIIAASLSED